MRWCRWEDVEKRINQLTVERDEQNAENGKLRLALEQIAKHKYVWECAQEMAREAMETEK